MEKYYPAGRWLKMPRRSLRGAAVAIGLSHPMRHKRMPGWAIPVAYSSTAVLLGMALLRIETLPPGLAGSISVAAALIIDVWVLLSTIALASIVFLLASVMIQFAATEYATRMVPWVARDPLIMHAIGILTATILYAIAELVWIDRHGSGEVPFISTLPVIGLLLGSVGVFVGLVRRSSLLHVRGVLNFAAERARRIIERLYPSLDVIDVPASAGELERVPVTQVLLKTGSPKTIQAIDAEALLAAACDSGGIIEVVSAVGDTVGDGIVLLRVRGAQSRISERLLLSAVRVGDEGAFDRDPRYAFHLLVDVAIRALAPGVNDPSTGVQALDQIEDLLLRLGRRRFEIGAFRDRDGALRLVLPAPTWEDYLTLALEEIRHWGSASVPVMRRMRALLGDLMEALPAERRPALQDQQERLETVIAKSFEDDEEVQIALEEDRQGLGAPRRKLTGG